MVLLLVLTRQRGPLGPENDLTLPLSDTYVKTMFLAIFMQQDISIYYKMCQILLLKQKGVRLAAAQLSFQRAAAQLY